MTIKVSAIGMVSKIAPRDMKCSACGTVIQKGRVYVKTCSGRYCEPCGDSIQPYPFPIVCHAPLQPLSEPTS